LPKDSGFGQAAVRRSWFIPVTRQIRPARIWFARPERSGRQNNALRCIPDNFHCLAPGVSVALHPCTQNDSNLVQGPEPKQKTKKKGACGSSFFWHEIGV